MLHHPFGVTQHSPAASGAYKGSAEKIVIPAKAGIQSFDFAGFCFWQKRFF
ncbi:hypothetical protein [Aquaspirillum sp. LM1]|uniref:hypothetical protein n=1 Tax=Aquaspirillum sp. LM1 TaxID=1938604 RepID=UPI0015C5339B|nr:hypothetical protein [Aquaspirillum sp. LM1]